MAEGLLYTLEESFQKTPFGTATWRRYLKLWEELYCPLPTDTQDGKLVGATLHTQLEKAEWSRQVHKGNMSEWLEHHMGPNDLAAIVEDYARSSIRIRGYEEFSLSILRQAVSRAYTKAVEWDIESTQALRELEKRLQQQEKALEEIHEWARRTNRAVNDL